MGGISLTHILLIAIIFLVFFGPSKLPALGQSLGKAIRGFKQGLSEIDVEVKDIHDTEQVAHNRKNTETTSQKQKETQNS